jgi:hypothetical protein
LKATGCNINETASKILQVYQQLIAELVPGFVEAIYVYGSVTLGDYIPGRSDIDFVAISPQRASVQQYRALNRVHRLVQRSFPKASLSGIYVCWDDLGKSKNEIAPFPYCNSDQMHRAGFFELNEVTWWQLKHKSIRLLGKCDERFQFGVSADRLKKSVSLNIRNYWKPWVDARSSYLSYERWLMACFPRLVEWGVLTLSRQYYTLVTGDVTSKTNGGIFCLRKLTKKYDRFLQEVIEIRYGQTRNGLSMNFHRSTMAIDYMRYLIFQCEQRGLFKL